MSSRNNTIDIARGIGIIFVVFGHNWIVLHQTGELFRIIFSFHMPLFFFLSGIFLRESDSLKQFIFSKIDSLLKPYLVVLTLLGIAKILRPTSLFTYFFGTAYATIATIPWEPLWFLPHLFVALLFSRGILQTTKDFNFRPLWIACIATFLAIVGIAYINIFWQIDISNWSYTNLLFGKIKHLPGLPWSLDLICLSSAYILCGFLVRQNIKSITFHPPTFSIAVLIFFLLHYYFDQTINIAMRLHGDLLIATSQAILGIYIVVAISALLDTFTILGKTLAYLGSSSLFILIFHDAAQSKTFEVLGKFSKAEYLNGAISFLVAMILPIVCLEITKRQRFLSAILLPRKSAMI
jgi:polysaccharide biosynthesis protein PslL